MAPRGFFDCLDIAAVEQRQARAVEVALVDDQSTDADLAAGSSSNNYSRSNRNSPLAEAADTYGSGQK